MKTQVQKEVTVVFEMTKEEFESLLDIVGEWEDQIGRLLPTGPPLTARDIISTMHSVAIEARR